MKQILYTLLIFTFTAFSSNPLHAQCFDDGHSPFQNQGWLSCSTNVGPIPERGDAHWILYDFGHSYSLDSLHFWNHNVWGETGMGAKSVLIDFSLDKENWKTVGPINIDKAPGSWKYTGVDGPVLDNVFARYALITVLSTWEDGASCAGLGEIKFGVNGVVDVEDVEPDVEWSISPNPAIDRINVQMPADREIIQLSVYNAVGQLMENIQIPSSNEMIVPIQDYREGMYFFTITTEKSILTKSFIKG
ncbi:MAG: T9SS type A sorting domain-containing protein [Saprospiraceae bacterium]|nr:T9SS type A sorting domain-containing protein [Saprospiraceae bacterium]